MKNNPEQAIFHLIRYAVANVHVNNRHLTCKDWFDVYTMAKEQGVAGICFDALVQLKQEGKVDIDPILFTEWYGTIKLWENVYKTHQFEIKNLNRFYKHFGIRMFLLKGVGASVYWPAPQHRPCGDIDIFLVEDKDLCEKGEIVCAQKRGDGLIAEKLNIDIKDGAYRHSDFDIDGVHVENHKAVLYGESHEANMKIEETLQFVLKKQCGISVSIADEEVKVPSPTFNALYLLRHAGLHFATERLLLRQVLDWGLMVQRCGKTGIDWEFVLKHVREQGMERFMDCMIEICVDNLGMDEACFPKFHRRGKLKQRVLADIIAPEFGEENDVTIGLNAKFISYKVRRFITNRWKYQLVYPIPIWKIFQRLACHRITHLFKGG